MSGGISIGALGFLLKAGLLTTPSENSHSYGVGSIIIFLVTSSPGQFIASDILLISKSILFKNLYCSAVVDNAAKIASL